MTHEQDDSERGGERNDLNGHSSSYARLMQEAIDWTVVQHGGRGLGPFSPTGLVRAWQFYLCRGRGHEVSMYAITAHGRTVYLPRPSGDEVPRGVRVKSDQVWLDGLDERGQRVSLRRMACAEVECYLFLTSSLDLLA